MSVITSDQFPMVLIILAVAILSFILTTIGIRSYLTTRDRRIVFVASAFGIFFIKNITIAFSLLFNIFHHTELELIGSLFDLITLILLFIPVIKKDL